MNQGQTVTVYSFHLYEGFYEAPRVSAFKATREAVEQIHHGEILEGTAEQVSAEDLDTAGRYVRVASGWVGFS
jgi:hypothetical protein